MPAQVLLPFVSPVTLRSISYLLNILSACPFPRLMLPAGVKIVPNLQVHQHIAGLVSAFQDLMR